MLTLAFEVIFMDKSNFYKQSDKVAMESPSGPTLATFFLGHI